MLREKDRERDRQRAVVGFVVIADTLMITLASAEENGGGQMRKGNYRMCVVYCLSG